MQPNQNQPYQQQPPAPGQQPGVVAGQAPPIPPIPQQSGDPGANPANPTPQGQPNAPLGPGPATPVTGGGQTPQMTEVEVRNPNSAQNSLLITEIRDGLVVMNDGSFRTVVACKSINFDLMSDREREAVEYSYQSFLNSLYFPVQIFIRSQRVDIAPYIDRLDKIRRDQDNMLLGVLMDDYINFIAALAEETNIMDKSFFIVIPYYIAGDVGGAVAASKNMMSNMFAPQKQVHITIDEQMYSKAKDELANRVNTVVNGLYQIGVRSVQLNTKELSELYYNVYNPDTAVREPLGDFENITGAAVIRKGQGQAPQPNLDDRGGM
jgi:hypothetical protein